MAQKKSGGKTAAKKNTGKKPAEKKLTAAEKRAKQEAEQQEASVKQRVRAEVLGVVLMALGILLGLYLYFSTEAPLGVALQNVLFGAVGIVALGLPPFLLILGIFAIAGRKRLPASGGVVVTVLFVVFVAALLHLLAQVPVQTAEGKNMPIGQYLVSCYDRALYPTHGKSRGGGIIGGLLCYLLEIIGGRTLGAVVLVAGVIVCLLVMTRISLKTFPELVKNNLYKAMERFDAEEGEDIDPEAEAIPARRRMFVETIDPEDTPHLEDIPKPGEPVPAPKAPEKKARKKEKVPFDEAFFVPEAEAAAPELRAFPKQGPLQRKPHTGRDFEEMEPVDDVLRLPNEEPLPANKPSPFAVTPEVPAPAFSPAPRRAKSPKPVEIEPIPEPEPSEAWEADFAPLPEPEEAPMGHNKPKALSMQELSAFAEATPYEEGEAPLPEPERAPDKKFVYHDEATGEALPEPLAVPAMEYRRPSLDNLKEPERTYRTASETPQKTMELLIDTLASFNIEARALGYSVGPVVTRYELQPAKGVRVNRITTLSNDIALALAAPRVRIEAPIPGKAAVGVEVPNKTAATVLLKEILDTEEFRSAKSPVTMAIGKDIGGKIVVADLSKMPHMLIAGSTGSGKSVCINDIILSMIFKSAPKDLRFIMVDPKQVELSVYGSLPHLLIPVVTDPKKAASALRWAVNEMTLRYKKFSDVGARELVRYNDMQTEEDKRLPRVVVIIDELADLMMVAPDEVEDCICRIAQLGRAAGIHLIVATQRPSADVITGLIKANIPSRAAFAVSSAIDSRIILDSTGAEKLLGRGDCLFHPNGAAKPTRLQAAFVSDEEVEAVVDDIKTQNGNEPQFDKDVELAMAGAVGGAKGGVFGEGKQEDELLGEAVRIVLDSGQASISMIQRKLRVGYARAARLVDMMEEQGYVSGFDGSKPRKVLIKRAQWEAIFGDGSASYPEEAEEADGEDLPWDEEEDQ